MSDALLVAITNGIFAVIVIILGARLNNKVNKVRYQVENNHPKNLREESDERHDELKDMITYVLSEVQNTRKTIGRIWQRLERHSDQIHDLELTQPRPTTRKKR